MITNARVLDTEWAPSEIVHRNAEKNRLRDALAPALEGDRASDVLITGPSGSGKTCLATYTLTKLREQAFDIVTTHVDCWQLASGFRVLCELLDPLNRSFDVHRSTPRDELIGRLAAHDGPYIAVLDEADQLDDQRLVRQLFGIAGLTTVLITNDDRALVDAFDERLQSRLRASVTVEFDRYSAETLVDILRARADAGLRAGAVDEATLEYIATVANGNARDAIATLRKAAHAAERDGAGQIQRAHVETALPAARREQRQKDLDRLTDEQQLVFELVRDREAVSPGTLYEAYTTVSDSPVSKRTVRTYLRKLEQYNLVESHGQGPSREYQLAADST